MVEEPDYTLSCSSSRWKWIDESVADDEHEHSTDEYQRVAYYKNQYSEVSDKYLYDSDSDSEDVQMFLQTRANNDKINVNCTANKRKRNSSDFMDVQDDFE